ncbi:MAG TPA: tyrosine-type recombinase/integrase [Burkholderiales bacterium]|nr:tyrosine-type recombinase/integrase [Burkholderiales bacterium]
MPAIHYNKLTDNMIKQWIKSRPPVRSTINDGRRLYLRMYKDNQPSFWFFVTLKTASGTKKTWYTLGKYPELTLEQARKKANGVRTLIANGINPATYSSDIAKLGKTWGEVHELYKAEHVSRLRPRSIESWNTVMQRMQVLDNAPIEKITEIDLQLIIDKADKSGAKSVSAGLLQRTKQVFKWAKKEGYLTSNNLIEMDRTYKVNVVERYLQPQEIASFYNQLFADNSVLAITKAVLYSLLVCLSRKNELLNLKWENVDIETGRVIIEQTKAISNFTMIVPQQVLQVWLNLRKLNPDSPYVFATKSKSYHESTLRNDLNWTIGRYGIKKWTPHDLRRTGMTLLAELGHRFDVIDSALGHVVAGVKKHYLKSNLLQERKELLQKWADYIDTLLNTENKPVGNNWLWYSL